MRDSKIGSRCQARVETHGPDTVRSYFWDHAPGMLYEAIPQQIFQGVGHSGHWSMDWAMEEAWHQRALHPMLDLYLKVVVK